jgi:hypothetical protein
MPAPNLLGRCRTTGEQISSTGIPTPTPGINQHSPLDSLTPALQKKKCIINKELKRTCSRGAGCTECTREEDKSKELISM